MNVKDIIIVGAGDHGRVVLDVCRRASRVVRGFIDPGKDKGMRIHGAPVLGGDELLADKALVREVEFAIGSGDVARHHKLTCLVESAQGEFATLVHPDSVVSDLATLGTGTLVNAGAVVNIDARIGRHCILNTNSSVDHDCVIEDGSHIGPGATLAGAVHCEPRVFVGSNATVLPYVRIGAESVIGAGAVVAESIPQGSKILTPISTLSERSFLRGQEARTSQK